MKRVFGLFLLSALLLGACGKTSETEGPGGDTPGKSEERKTVFSDFSLKPTTVYFGEEFEKYISVVDTNIVILHAETPEALIPLTGEVILVPPSGTHPDGFLGKVSAITRNGEAYIQTEPAALDEVFEELHINKEVNVSELMDEVVDEEGNLIQCGYLPDEVWEDPEAWFASLSDQDPAADTKAWEASAMFTRSIPFKTDWLTGEIVFSATLSVKIDISDGKLSDYDIVLTKKSYMNGTAEVSVETKNPVRKRLLGTTIRLPFSIPVGGIPLRPAIVSSLDFVASGEIKMGAAIGIGMEDVETRWHNGEHTKTIGASAEPHIGAYYLDAEGTFGLEARTALQFGVFGQQLLAFGIDGIASAEVAMSGQIHMDNTELLKKKLTATLTMGKSFGFYLYSPLLSSHLDKMRVDVKIPNTVAELDILDIGKGLKLDKGPKDWTVNGTFAGKQFMQVDEKGVALFVDDDDNPLEIKAMKKGPATRASAGSGSVTFEIPNDGRDYRVCPYNKVDKYYFYGDPISQKLVKAISSTVDGWESYCFGYDSQGRLISWSTADGILVARFTYGANTIVAHGNLVGARETITAHLDESGRLTRSVEVYEDGDGVFTHVITVDYGKDNTPYFSGETFDTVQYSSGNHKSEWGCTYSYGGAEDNLNLDIFHAYLRSDVALMPFMSFPHIHNKNLCTGFSRDGVGTFNISYTFDEDGDVSVMTIGGAGSLRFSYY